MPYQIARETSISVPAEDRLGPSMRALTEPQRRFVVAMLETGAQKPFLCARAAGYGNTEGSTRIAAFRLMHTDKVLAAIKEEADKRLRSGAILGASVLVEIASDPQHKDRFKAGVELLNRSGLLVETQHRVVVEDDRRNRKEVEDAVIALANRLGLDPAGLLGYQPDQVVDSTYTDVEPEMSSDGLEDLL